MRVEDFNQGDRVEHRSMSAGPRCGTVLKVAADGVHVQYDRQPSDKSDWGGIYDRRWFELHPGLLVKIEAN